MYNRYIPQSDGSYRRSRIPEPEQPLPQSAPPEPAPRQETTPAPPVQNPPPNRPMPAGGLGRNRHRPQGQKNPGYAPPPRDMGVGQFLRQLLPRDFDTEDLLIVLLLLLMSGDSREDSNTALLTLALYLFL